MRTDLGRLDAIPEILQVGPALNGPKEKRPMKILSAAAALVLLTVPAFAQMPQMNLVPELASKSPEEKEQDAIKDQAYRESLKKIPDAKTSSDPWAAVRNNEAPKAAAPARSKTKTGSSTAGNSSLR
jgi:hypothetical protein